MKNLKKADFIAAALCLCAVIPGAAVYGRLPDRITTHWNLQSEANGSMPKALAVFGIPVLFAVLTLFFCAVMRKAEEKQSSGKPVQILRFLLPALLFMMQSIILLAALGKLRDISSAAFVLISAFMIILGNYMPKLRKNALIGIRTPHIMANEAVWYKTHRLAGMTVTAGGILSLAASLAGYFPAAFVIMMVSLLIPAIYGEVIYFKNKKRA